MDSRARNTASAQKRKSYGLLSHAAFCGTEALRRKSTSSASHVPARRSFYVRAYTAPAFVHYTPPPLADQGGKPDRSIDFYY
jgi:hypothetical protein